MQVVAPDFARRIDLAGAGPCPRPVDIDRTRSGFADLATLRVYAFTAGMTIAGEAEGDEVFVVAMRGDADIAVDVGGARFGDYPLRAGGGPRVVYLPPHVAYTLHARTDCAIAYARTCPDAPDHPPPASFADDGGGLAVADHAVGMEVVLAALWAGATHALVATDGRAPERFVHVRGGAADVGGDLLPDWGSGILGDGETAALSARDDIEVLLVSARARRAASGDAGGQR